jgi:predicted DNA-binding transcriptional regulator AlpA
MDIANLLGISKSSAYELAEEQSFPKLNVVASRTIVPRDRIISWIKDNIVY